MTRPMLQAISPSFIVSDVGQTIAFYRDRLGFETRFQQPDRKPFFAILGRDGGFTKGVATVDLIVPGNVTARIQEAQKVLFHALCEMVEEKLPKA